MNSVKTIIFTFLIISFLFFSFYPTIFELSKSNNLADNRREFILEHNFYWPDYNLYLSKIRQGIEDQFTAVEKYTSELHQGSLIQEFYVVLGQLGKILNLDPNSSYLFGRIILAPLLLLIIILLAKNYFPSFSWQILAFTITVVSGSFPNIFQDSLGVTHISRFMEWWSNIDALQRITFIPHILFAQVISFYLLYQLAMNIKHSTFNIQHLTKNRFIFYSILGNIVGIVFPPSLIILNSVLVLLILINLIQQARNKQNNFSIKFLLNVKCYMLYIVVTLPSLLYIFLITKQLPWSALVDFHRTHPMMIPFDQYILGTGPIFFLGFFGAIVSIIKRDKKWQPLIFWVLATFSFAAIFSILKDQSPLRFTQTGLFIPLGFLGTYFFYQLFHLNSLKTPRGWQAERSEAMTPATVKVSEIATAAFIIILSLYILGSLFIMKNSLDWQIDWISQRIGAFNPDVPYPPQSMYPLREWMDGIRWLKSNTKPDDVVLAEITAANHIPAYSGNTVYWGQANTVDYNRKEIEVDKFFRGKMSENEARLFLKNGRIKYVFFSIQEKGKSGGKSLDALYPNLKSKYTNPITTIYSVE